MEMFDPENLSMSHESRDGKGVQKISITLDMDDKDMFSMSKQKST